MPAEISVSFSADSASDSVSAAQYTSTPLENACTNTATSGTNRNSVRKASAVPISARRTHAGSLTASVARGGASGRTRGPASATASVSVGRITALIVPASCAPTPGRG